MLLTVVNIVVIVVIGVAMLRAREYGPQSSTFWKQDIGLARTLRNSSTFKELGRKLKTSFKDPGAACSHLPRAPALLLCRRPGAVCRPGGSGVPAVLCVATHEVSTRRAWERARGVSAVLLPGWHCRPCMRRRAEGYVCGGHARCRRCMLFTFGCAGSVEVCVMHGNGV